MSTPPWIDDYHALVEGRGVAALAGWSSVVAAGADAGTLLNNFCTNDIPKLEVGKACEAFFPNAKGKVLAFGWVWRTDETTFRIVLGSDRAGELAIHLDRYVIREDVALTTNSDALTLSLSGEDETALPAFGTEARLLTAPANEPSVVAEAFTAYRVEQRVPLDATDVDDSNLPQELNRDATAISFTKGCYLGQETVARIDALGRVNQTLVSLKVDGGPAEAAIAAGAELMAGEKVVGRVTSATWSPKHDATLALGYVRREHAAADTPLACDQQQVLVLG